MEPTVKAQSSVYGTVERGVMAEGSGSGGGEPTTEEEVVARFNGLRQEVSALFAKIGELTAERQEHDLVADTLKPLPAGRRCFRLVGGVLVERTVEEVLPAIQRNKEGLATLLEKLEQQLEAKKAALTAFQEKYKIRVRGEDQPLDAAAAAAPANQGVLVGSS